MSKEEIKDYISRMNIDQLRESLLETTLLVYHMKEMQDQKLSKLKDILIERNQIKKTLS